MTAEQVEQAESVEEEEDYGYGDDAAVVADYGYNVDGGEGDVQEYEYGDAAEGDESSFGEEEDDDDDDDADEMIHEDDSDNVDDANSDDDDNANDPMRGLARRENRAVTRFRGSLLTILALAAIGVSMSTYITCRHCQHAAFVANFESISIQILSSYSNSWTVKLQSLQSLAIDFTSYAKYSNSSWPCVTLPDWQQHAIMTQNVIASPHATSIFILPIVAANNTDDPAATRAARQEWESYAVQHSQDWLSKSTSTSSPAAAAFSSALEDTTPVSSSALASSSRALFQQQSQSSQPTITTSIPEHIFDFTGDYNDTNNDTVVHTGPFAPLWQTSPLTNGLSSWINFNMLAFDRVSFGLHHVMHTQHAVLERVINHSPDSDSNEPPAVHALLNAILGHDDSSTNAENDYFKEPVSPLFYPIIQKKDDDDKEQVVAVVTAMIYWRFVLEHLLLPSTAASATGSSSITVVIQNSCNNIDKNDSTSSSSSQQQQQAFTYEINGKDNATYLGWGDLHDAKFNKMMAQTTTTKSSSSSSSNTVPLDDDYCSFTLTVYPTTSMMNQYITKWEPLLHASFTICIFGIAVVVFLTYDVLVERRQKVVMNHAMRATAVVSSLFPEAVRDRLFAGEDPHGDAAVANAAAEVGSPTTTTATGAAATGGATEQNSDAAAATSGSCDNASTDGSNDGGASDLERPLLSASTSATSLSNNINSNTSISQTLAEPAKMRLKNFLHKQDPVSNMESAAKGSTPAMAGKNSGVNKPIADLFPHCTVLFADISGFTAWSSLRDPAQVFTLLESIYSSFDAVARKRGVFKVETVGDSYVAVTGLPDPQEDHAIIMSRFARDCRVKMNEVTRKLELTLGPDTGDLCMRFGLHSGPVTAGVLRGERSRFQLFGDTVNTAARMESTGQRDKIQCSQSTADLLRAAGKGNWVKARDELVNAKGKGQLQTYWIDVSPPPQQRRESGDGISRSNHSSDMGSVDASDDYASPEQSNMWGGTPDEIPEHVKQHQKHQRLVDYNIDLLCQHLKCVVARRQVLAMSGLDDGPPPEPYIMSTELEAGKCVLDEVTEVIRLPKFDPSAFKGHVDPESIELDRKVVSQLKRYVTVIGAMYRQNPFHNFEHASHVVMSVNKLLQRIVAPDITITGDGSSASQKIAEELHQYTYGITSDPLAQFAILFAALIHDVDHQGVSNGQLVVENSPQAARYTKSIAEQNSVDLAWDLLMDPDEYGDLQRCIFKTDAEYKRFRAVVVNLVMATDIFDKELGELRKNRWAKAFEADREPDEDDENRKATIVMEHIMQASDVAHTMQHWHVYQKWNRRLFDELYSAHKAGRMGPDPTTFWINGEKKFFEGYIIPLAKKLQDCGVFGVSSEECLNYAMCNLNEWETKGDTIVAELIANYNKREEEDRLQEEAGGGAGGGRKKNKKRTMMRRRSLFTSGG